MAASRSESSVALKLSKISSYLTSFQVDVPNYKTPPRLSSSLTAAGSSSNGGGGTESVHINEEDCQSAAAAALPPPVTLTRNTISTYYDSTRELFTDDSFKSLGKRIKTYGEQRWMLPVEVLSVYVCARRGWYMVAPDMLRCSDCSELLSLALPSPAAPHAYARALQLLQERVHKKHLACCRWRLSPSQLACCRPPPLLEPAAMYALVQLAHDMATSAMCTEQPYMADDGYEIMRQMGVQDGTLDAVLGLGHTTAQRTALLLLLCGWKQTSVPGALRCELCKRRIGLWCFRSVEEQKKLCSKADAASALTAGDSLTNSNANDGASNIADGAMTVTESDGTPTAAVVAPSLDEVSSAAGVNKDGSTPAASAGGDPSASAPSGSAPSELPASGNAADVHSDTQSEHAQKTIVEESLNVGVPELKEGVDVQHVSVPSTEEAAMVIAAVEESGTAVAASDTSKEILSSPSETDAPDSGCENVAVTKTNVDCTSEGASGKSLVVNDNSEDQMNKNDGPESSNGAAEADDSNAQSHATDGAKANSALTSTDVGTAANCEVASEATSNGSQPKRRREELEDEGSDNPESADGSGESCLKKSKVSIEEGSSALVEPQETSRNHVSKVTCPPAPRPVLCPVWQHHAWCGWVTPARHHVLPGDDMDAEDRDTEGYKALSSQLLHTLRRAAAQRWTQQEKYSTCVQGVRSVRALLSSWLHDRPSPHSPSVP